MKVRIYGISNAVTLVIEQKNSGLLEDGGVLRKTLFCKSCLEYKDLVETIDKGYVLSILKFYDHSEKKTARR